MKGLLLSSVAKVEEKDLIVSPAASRGFLTEDECDGGDLEFMFGREFKSRGRGSITVFPSYLPHRVTPVTRGSRCVW